MPYDTPVPYGPLSPSLVMGGPSGYPTNPTDKYLIEQYTPGVGITDYSPTSRWGTPVPQPPLSGVGGMLQQLPSEGINPPPQDITDPALAHSAFQGAAYPAPPHMALAWKLSGGSF